MNGWTGFLHDQYSRVIHVRLMPSEYGLPISRNRGSFIWAQKYKIGIISKTGVIMLMKFQ
jgi:hypothetical protein